MLRVASKLAAPGDVVAVYDKKGERFGSGFYNPHSNITLRMLCFDASPIDAAYFRDVIGRAVSLRRNVLRLDESTNAYRVFYSEGDGMSGLVVDRFDDVLSIDVFSYGVYQQLESLIPILHEACGTTKLRIHVGERVGRLEGFDGLSRLSPGLRSVRVVENGHRFAVDFETGHKTGFFCDQRDNRLGFSKLVVDRDVLDLCCYTGGFSVYAATSGNARSVTGVDLDETALDQARHNGNLNQAKIRWVHADAFHYVRQMIANDRRWDAVVVDPPKLITDRNSVDEGRRKYYDLNRLSLALVSPGGLFLTCSCSGLMSADSFEKTVLQAARSSRRKLQILGHSGASADHPVMSNCLEGRYLKAIWARVI